MIFNNVICLFLASMHINDSERNIIKRQRQLFGPPSITFKKIKYNFYVEEEKDLKDLLGYSAILNTYFPSWTFYKSVNIVMFKFVLQNAICLNFASFFLFKTCFLFESDLRFSL